MKGFYRDIIIATIALGVGAWATAEYGLHTTVPISFWISLIIVLAMTWIIHGVMVKANDKRPQLFVTYFMGTLTAKLFISAMVLVSVGVLDRDNLTFTAIGYFLSYILLTGLEIRYLLPLVRNSNH